MDNRIESGDVTFRHHSIPPVPLSPTADYTRTPPTAQPCPSWCEYEPCHGYESETLNGSHEIRYHVRHVAAFPVAGVPTPVGTLGDTTVYVDIESEEAASATGVQTSGPRITLDLNAAGWMTADEALQLVAGLTQAMNLLQGLEEEL